MPLFAVPTLREYVFGLSGAEQWEKLVGWFPWRFGGATTIKGERKIKLIASEEGFYLLSGLTQEIAFFKLINW